MWAFVESLPSLLVAEGEGSKPHPGVSGCFDKTRTFLPSLVPWIFLYSIVWREGHGLEQELCSLKPPD